MTTVTFNFEQTFQEGFERFAEETGRGLNQFMEFEVMRVLVETCYHWTPPPTKGNRGARGGRKGGQYIISRDVAWIVNEVSQAYIDILAERFGSGPINSEFRRKDGSVYLIENTWINEDGDHNSIHAWHQKNRKQNGRVLTHANRVSRDIGRWRPRNKMLVPKGTKDRYVKSVQVRVGKLKAGWAPALRAVHSLNLPPGWVNRAGAESGASGTSTGTYKNALMNFTGFIEAENTTPYFRDQDGFMRRAHSYTETFFNGPRFEKWLQATIDRHRSVQTSRGAR